MSARGSISLLPRTQAEQSRRNTSNATKQKPEPNENRDRNRVKQSDVRSPCCNPHVNEREDQSFKGNFKQRESHKGTITTIRRCLGETSQGCEMLRSL
ncbi:hypothetical protein YC2023_094097 [Brassica napus]